MHNGFGTVVLVVRIIMVHVTNVRYTHSLQSNLLECYAKEPPSNKDKRRRTLVLIDVKQNQFCGEHF